MSKNRKIIIVCLVILLVILLSIVLYNIFSFSNETDSKYVDKTIRVCRKDVQCGIADLKFNFIKLPIYILFLFSYQIQKKWIFKK